MMAVGLIIWESQAAFDRFFVTSLGPAFEKVAGCPAGRDAVPGPQHLPPRSSGLAAQPAAAAGVPRRSGRGLRQAEDRNKARANSARALSCCR